MADSVKIMGDCIERVALDLAVKINYDSRKEQSDPPPKKSEKEWLTLYERCLHVVLRGSTKDLPQD